MGKTYRIITLGCKVNQYESAFLGEALQKAGCRQAAADERADITIVNTCIVTQRAAYQSRQAIRRAVRENPAGTVAAAGCYAQTFPDELTRIRGLGLVADNLSRRIHEQYRPFITGTFDHMIISRFIVRRMAILSSDTRF